MYLDITHGLGEKIREALGRAYMNAKEPESVLTVKFQGLSGSGQRRSKRTPVGINLVCDWIYDICTISIDKKGKTSCFHRKDSSRGILPFEGQAFVVKPNCINTRWKGIIEMGLYLRDQQGKVSNSRSQYLQLFTENKTVT